MNNKFKALVSIITIVLSAQIFTIPVSAAKPQKPVQLQEGDVKILASGTSMTENEAIAMALRSALEQAFGTFVSANTTLVNDALVKDEIVSITTGNIKHYDIINSTLLPNGNTTVLLNAIVSTDNLVKYAQNHGSSTELAGNKLAMAMHLEQMNIESERKTMQNLMEQLEAFLPNLFDYGIEVGEPNIISSSNCEVPLKVIVKSNQNTLSFQKLLKNTLLSMPDATGKIGDVVCSKFILFGNIKQLTRDIWLSAFYQLFNGGIIPQLTAFNIVDQNNNILGGVKFTPDDRSINTRSCPINVNFFGHVNDKCRFDAKLYQFYQANYKIEDYYLFIQAPQYINCSSLTHMSNEIHAVIPGLYYYQDGIYKDKESHFYGNVFDAGPGYVIFPFPEIAETNPGNKKTKKSKAFEAIPSSIPLFCIQGLTLTFNTEELNMISEIRAVPKK